MARHQTRSAPTTRPRVRRPGPVPPGPVRAPPSVPATPVPVHTYIRPCASRRPHSCGPDARGLRSHPPAPSSPPANSCPHAHSRQRTSPAARVDSRTGTRSPRPLPVSSDPGHAKPSCGTSPRGGSEIGTVPPPGAAGCGVPRRPSQSRRHAPSGAALACSHGMVASAW